MREFDSESRKWARELLDREVGDRQRTTELAEAAQRICERLHRQLSTLIGSEGVTAVLRRALRMAQDDFPFLKGVEVQPLPNGCLKGLGQSVEAQMASEVRDGLVAIIGNAIWLLVTFIGRDLTLRQLKRIWPNAALDSASSSPEEAER